MPRWLVVLFFGFGTFAMLLAAQFHCNRLGEPSWPVAMFGSFASAFPLLRSFFVIRLGNTGICFGLRCRHYVAFADIVTLECRSDGRESTCYLVLRSGKQRRTGSILPCEQMFIDALQKHSLCTVVRRRPGQCKVIPPP